MTLSGAMQGTIRRLELAGYAMIKTPFSVASVEFEFAAAMRGSKLRGLDLILLIDTSTGGKDDGDGDRVYQRIEALSNALDVTGSRLVLTTILVGATLSSETTESLSTLCRVLLVQDIAFDAAGVLRDKEAERRLDDAIRVLLPLQIEAPQDGEGEDTNIMRELRGALGGIDATLVKDVLAASLNGDKAVARAFGRRIDAVLLEEGEE